VIDTSKGRPPHAGGAVVALGAPLDAALGVMVMVHGRGATAHSILELTGPLGGDQWAYVAPQASGNTWYPQSFLQPIHINEPGISSGLSVLHEIFASLEAQGIGAERTILLGFSQGACLSLEYVARNARRFGGVAGLSGGLIGPPGTPRDYDGNLSGTPVFLGCSDIDSHIPAARVRETATVLETLGGRVTMRLYEGMGHTVNDDEIAAVREMMRSVAG
jgi:predicted esterase